MVKILVVSADDDTRALIVFTLRFAGHQLKSASSVEETIELVKQFKPELILLDAMVPDVVDIKPDHYLKSSGVTAGIPLVIFNSNSNLITTSAEKTSQVDDYFPIGLSPDQLADRVNLILKRVRK